MKRAAIIITDADEIGYQELRRNAFGEYASAGRRVMPSEQLLADLRTTVHLAETRLLWNEVNDLSPKTYADWTERVARVRALLPEEGEDE